MTPVREELLWPINNTMEKYVSKPGAVDLVKVLLNLCSNLRVNKHTPVVLCLYMKK